MKTMSHVVISVLLFNSIGCATIFKGSKEKVNFSSEPAGATIYLNGQSMGSTPTELTLQSKTSYNVEFRKKGYQNKTVVLSNSVGAGWIILDVFFAFIPMIVDAATGNWYGFDSNHIAAALEPQQSSSMLYPSVNSVAACTMK